MSRLCQGGDASPRRLCSRRYRESRGLARAYLFLFPGAELSRSFFDGSLASFFRALYYCALAEAYHSFDSASCGLVTVIVGFPGFPWNSLFRLDYYDGISISGVYIILQDAIPK